MQKLEIIVTSLEDALQASIGGADSLEVISAFALEGLTPLPSLVDTICEHPDLAHLEKHVMIRPHADRFQYTDMEVTGILSLARAFGQMPITSLVLGKLTEGGEVDIPFLEQIKKVSNGKNLTLHRAIDVSTETDRALSTIHDAELVDRVLTSGKYKTAWEGRFQIQAWVQRFAKINFVCGSGVNSTNIQQLVAFTGATILHVGTAARSNDAVDTMKVRQLRTLLDESV